MVGEPINPATGNVAEQVTDYTTAGQNPLAFTRSYNSMANMNSSPVASALGVNWRHGFDRYLIIQSPTNVLAERPDGSVLAFVESGGIWRTSLDMDLKLTGSGTSWVLTDQNDTQETYATSGSEALLQKIKLRNGYTQTLTYSDGLLNSVTDSYGRSLGFTYNGKLLDTVTTPDGLVMNYGFTAAGGEPELTRVGYNTSPATGLAYLYENAALPFSLTGITDENGHRYMTWTYDSQGRATSSQNGDGTDFNANLHSVAYDDSTGNRTVTSALGQQATYKFTLFDGAYKISEVDRLANAPVPAATRTYTYDGGGYLASMTDWNGNLTKFTNNSHGLPTSITEASGSAVSRTTSISHDTTWIHLPKTVATKGLSTTFTYDGGGNLQTRTETDTTSQTAPYSTNGQSRTTAYTWTATGQLQTVQQPRSDVPAKTTYIYAGGTLTGIADALGHATSITSSTAGGLPRTIVDPNGVTTTLTYDQRQHLLSSSLATTGGSRTTFYGYDPAENLTSVTLPDGAKLTNTYDDAHRLTAVADLYPHTESYTRDAAGNVTVLADKDSGGTTTRNRQRLFDATGRLITDIGGQGQTTRYVNDANGNPTSITDPLTNPATVQVFDALNRLSQVTDRAAGVTKIAYDTHDRPLSVTTPNGAKTSYVYDGFGDLIQQISPDSGTTVYRYDPDGNLTSKTDALGIVANYTYDALDRRLTVSYPAATTENVTYKYDQTTHGKGIGRLTSGTDQAGSFSRSYDERGNITTENHTHGAYTLTNRYSYDAVGRLATLTYPDGLVVKQGRNSAGYVTSLSLKPSSTGAYQTVMTNGHYLSFGPMNTFTYGNGVADARSYDHDYRLTKITDIGTTTIQSLTYGLDTNDNTKTITDAVNAANSQSLAYDPLDRLTTAQGAYGSQSYGYDANGNRSNLNGTAWSYTAKSNRLTSIGATSVSTNLNGNTTGIAYASPITFNYNKANRLASVTGSGSLSYLYDAIGQRVTKTDTATRFLQYGQNGELLATTDNAGSTARDYVYLEGRPVATFVPNGGAGTLNFLYTDRVDQPLRATTGSSTAIGWSFNPDPFGAGMATTSAIANELRFPGQENELNLTSFSLNHNGWRDYAPGFGRYLESDPIGFAGGQLSTYAYAGSNSEKFIDFSGLVLSPFGDGPMNPILQQQTQNDTAPDVYRNVPLSNTFSTWGTYAALGAAAAALDKNPRAVLVLGGAAICLDAASFILNPTPQSLLQNSFGNVAGLTEGGPLFTVITSTFKNFGVTPFNFSNNKR